MSMNRIAILQVAAILGVLSFGATIANAASGCGSVTTASTCRPGARPVFEVPAGVIDGRNATFNLSSSPLPGSLVRVFDNGIEDDDHEYQVKGQSVIFMPTAVPIPGDVINVFYDTQASANDRSQVAPALSPDRDQIGKQLLQQSVQQEVARALQANASTRAVVTPAGIISPADSTPQASAVSQKTRPIDPLPRAEEPRSLAMLAEVLRSTESAPTDGYRELKTKARRRISVNGVEGLGDSSVSTPFDYLTPSQNSELDELVGDSLSAGRSVAAMGRRSTYSAMRMLAERLSSQ